MSEPERKSVFKNPDAVEREMRLPAVVSYSFVGDSSPSYHARLVSTVEGVVGVGSVRRQSSRPSKSGKYAAYHFDVFHATFDEVEALYRSVCDLEGTRFVL
jgi:putative lipoic acid-binding regulatory protein